MSSGVLVRGNFINLMIRFSRQTAKKEAFFVETIVIVGITPSYGSLSCDLPTNKKKEKKKL
jgi:hypothetical protein